MRLSSSDRVALYVRVSVDGEDVTGRCFLFDSDEGLADCYVVIDNRIQIDEKTQRPVTARLRGTITTDPPLDQIAAKIAARQAED